MNKYKRALELFVEWVTECDFGYDNMPDLYDKYKKDIENMGYNEGLIYIALKEAENE